MDAEELGSDAPSTSNRDSERFFCPYPGCHRSFAELWRLKVHYRAPPDIRGSGKERGHGEELTQCPKCGKTLKPGKHHVGCSGGKTAPRQASRRKHEQDGDSGAQDEGQPPSKAMRVSDADKSVGAFGWPDMAHRESLGPYQMAPGPHGMPLQGLVMVPQPVVVKAEGQMQPQQHEVYYGHAAAPMTHYWPDPSQQNGMAQHIHYAVPQQHQLIPVPYPGGYPGGAAQQVSYTSFPGYMQMTSGQPTMVSGQVPMGMMQPMMAPPGTMLAPAPLPPQGMPHQPHQHQHAWPHQPHTMVAQLPLDAHAAAQAAASNAPPERVAPGSPMPSLGGDGGGMGDGDGPGRFSRIPSPPPLPEDFHAPITGTNPLFNFSQFTQKFPRVRSKLELTTAGLETPDPDLLVDHQDDGDLMQLLFGMPDDLPTMATIHLHKWAPGDTSHSVSGSLTPTFGRSGTPTRTHSAVGGGMFASLQGPGGVPHHGGPGPAAAQQDEALGGSGSAAAAVAASEGSSRAAGGPGSGAHDGHAGPGGGGLPSLGPSRLAHNGKDGIGSLLKPLTSLDKASLPGLPLLTNGVHEAEPHREVDHLLDAETQRLLTCD